MAIPSGCTWEVRTAGSSTNGGGYVSGGTDYSQQDSAQVSVTDAVANGTTTITSATAAFTTAHVGNIIYLQGGSGTLTATRRHVVSRTSATAIVVDATVASGSNITLKLGGALDSLGTMGGFATDGNWCYQKAGTYSIGSGTGNTSGNRLNLAVGGVAGRAFRVIGYQATRGDNGTRPINRAGANLGSVPILRASATATCFENLEVDGNVPTFSGVRGISVEANNCLVDRCVVKNCDIKAINLTNSDGVVRNTEVTGCSGESAVFSNGRGVLLSGCSIHGNAGAEAGVRVDVGMVILDSLIYGNTGSTTDGVLVTDSSGSATVLANCTVFGNGRHGVNYAGNSTGTSLHCRNAIFYGNTGTGIATSSASSGIRLLNCAGGGNASNYSTTDILSDQVEGFVTLSADPFVASGSADFRLNTTSGGGAACRAAGVPASWPGNSLTASYPDVGAAQHQDTGGGGGTTYVFSVEG